MKTLMTRGRVFVVLVGLMAVALVAAGCGNGNGGNGNNGGAGGLSAGQLEALARGAQGLGSGGLVQGTGLHVTGSGQATAEPDLAVLHLGAEASAKSVAEARNTVALAMNGVIAVLRAQGVAETDIQTSSFSIQPEYTYEEVVKTAAGGSMSIEGGALGAREPDGPTTTIRRTERVLVGYRVSNTLTVKVRDLDSIGPVIDGVTEAGGDATRINSIQFTLEDPSALAERARILAIEDAVAKARQFASVAGFELGKLQFITELGGGVFNQGVVRAESFSVAAATVISPGELDVTMTVQAVWAID